jgi:hypothetical protein
MARLKLPLRTIAASERVQRGWVIGQSACEPPTSLLYDKGGERAR